jgi:GxxExxY protein
MQAPVLSVDAERAIQQSDESSGSSSRLIHEHITGRILSAFFQVYRELGHGFQESVYVRALVIEMLQRGLEIEQDAVVSVFYKGVKLGSFKADLIVEGKVVVEVRAGAHLTEADRAELFNCMRCSQADVGMLLHFGARAEFRRFVGRHVFGRSPAPTNPPAGASQRIDDTNEALLVRDPSSSDDDATTTTLRTHAESNGSLNRPPRHFTMPLDSFHTPGAIAE